MVDLSAQLPDGDRHASISIAPFVAGKNGSNLLLQHLMLVDDLRHLLLVIEGAAGQSGQLEQADQRELLP